MAASTLPRTLPRSRLLPSAHAVPQRLAASLVSCRWCVQVSADPAHRGDILRVTHWAADWIRRLGGTVELVELGLQVRVRPKCLSRCFDQSTPC